MALRVLIGAGSEKIVKQLSAFFSKNGYVVVGEVEDGYDFLRKVHAIYPDVCVIDGQMRGLNSQEIAEVLVSEKIAPVIVLINELDLQSYAQLNQEATFVPMIKPLNKNMLLNTLEILAKTNQNIQKLEKEVKDLRNTKNEKELIQKAKKCLIEHMCLTEDEAHRRIQKQSMDKGISKVQIAEAILLMYE
jgi:response regulator NasT